VGQGSDKVEKVYVFEGYAVKKSENLRLYHFRSADKVYKTRPFLTRIKPRPVVARRTATTGRGFMLNPALWTWV
jgi:hypothetical protein